MDRRFLLLALGAGLLGTGLLGVAGSALADKGRGRGRGGDDDDDDRHDHDDVYDARRAGEILPLSRILPTVEAAYPGEILSIEFEHEDGRPVYEFKVLQRRGWYLEIYVDARTGEIIEVDGD